MKRRRPVLIDRPISRGWPVTYMDVVLCAEVPVEVLVVWVLVSPGGVQGGTACSPADIVVATVVPGTLSRWRVGRL